MVFLILLKVVHPRQNHEHHRSGSNSTGTNLPFFKSQKLARAGRGWFWLFGV
jgi:hypothetical protein